MFSAIKFANLEHAVTVVYVAPFRSRLAVKLPEKVESYDRVEINDHDHQQCGHDKLSAIV